MGIGNIANTGMNAALSNMETISNNIANANTYGFKKSSVSFADVYPAGGGASGSQPGLGVMISGITQDFSANGGVPTNAATDFSINNNGFFILKNPNTGAVSYTRYGHFELTPDQFLQFSGGRLQGYSAVNGSIVSSGTLSDIQIDQSPLPAKATAKVATGDSNLDASVNVPTATFSESDPTSYNYKTTTNIYDSLGNPYDMTLYYVKTSPDNWDVKVDVNGTLITTGTAAYDGNGILQTTTGLTGLNFTTTSGATSPQTFDIDMTGSTQFSIPNKSANVTQDGYPAGSVNGYEFNGDGVLSLQYSNNQNVVIGQIAIATFPSNDGLANIGNMSWQATSESGDPIITSTNSKGNITAKMLELSNVDLTGEMVDLISAQHIFQANAQVEQTYDQVMQTVIKL